MIGKVNPIMKEVFAGHDAEEYGDFDCVDCHGEEMREINFKMPAPSMYIVPPEGTPGHRGMLATFPEALDEGQRVTDDLAELGFDPASLDADTPFIQGDAPGDRKSVL